MARNPTFKPSFYKIMIDFTVDLLLPKEFMEKYGAILPRNVKLRIASGATWEVRVEKMEDERHFFRSGWTQFSRDMRLQKLDLVVFVYDGNDTFDVTMYATTTLEKVSSYPIGEVETAASESEGDDNSSNRPQFAIVMCDHHLYRMEFAEAAGLSRGERVQLEYPGGQSARVLVSTKPRRGSDRPSFSFSAGWADFRKANGLTIGNAYSFEFLSHSTNTNKLVLVKPLPNRQNFN